MPKKKLGNGWYEATDKKSGRTYYLHKDKRITQWNRPTEAELGGAEAAPDTPGVPTPPATPDGSANEPIGKWEKRVDKASGKPYYVNKTTRQSQWHKPDGFEDDTGGESKAPEKQQQQQQQEKPKKKKKSNTIRHGDWQVRKDKKGRVYYANVKTMTTQWNLPEELVGIDLTFPNEDGASGATKATATAAAPAASPAAASTARRGGVSSASSVSAVAAGSGYGDEDEEDGDGDGDEGEENDVATPLPVSYTHLTLPTIYSV